MENVRLFKILKIMFAVAVIFSFGVNFNIKSFAASDYLAIEYKKSDSDFETAFNNSAGLGSSFMDVLFLSVTGNGELSLSDCEFIRDNFSKIVSINFTEAKFKDNKIEDNAFKNYGNLQSIGLPESVKYIGASAFEGCYSLFNIGLSNNLIEIGERAFANCGLLENISLPVNLSKIGAYAFENCYSLHGIIALRDNLADYNATNNSFSNINKDCILVYNLGAKGAESTGFNNISKKAEWIFYNIPGNVYAAAGSNISLSVDVTDKNYNKANYVWYKNGQDISNNYGTGDTLIIENINENSAGKYGVKISIGGASVIFNAVVEITGKGLGASSYRTEDLAVNHKAEAIAQEALSSKYDKALILDNKGVKIYEKDLQTGNELENYSTNRNAFSFVVYTKKLKEMYNAKKAGVFELNLSGGGYVSVPFDLLESIKNINNISNLDLNKDLQLRININKSENLKENVYFELKINLEITDEKGANIYKFENLPNVWVYAPIQNNYKVYAQTNNWNYPVIYKITGNYAKFNVNNNIDGEYILKSPEKINFSDIENHWGKAKIETANSLNLVEGYNNKTYRPNNLLTRAEFTEMLARVLYNFNANNNYNNTNKNYIDIKSSDWFYNAIKITEKFGVLNFIISEKFEANSQITREEMAFMISEAQINSVGIESKYFKNVNYSDSNEINAIYKTNVNICTNTGILEGYDNKFNPKATLTRAEAATVLVRFYDWLSENMK